MVTVADNGIGVPPADHDRIFGMFTRAHRDHDGTGVGLAVCRRVAEAGASGSSPPTALFGSTLPR